MVGLKLCLQPYSESSLLPPLPPLPFLPRPSWAGGNIAEIVYHVANGSVLIIAVRVKRTVWKKGRETGMQSGSGTPHLCSRTEAEEVMKAH